MIPDFISHYSLDQSSSILDIGSGKGFMLHDFMEAIPGIKVRGIDISPYAIENSLEDVKPFQQVGDAKKLPFEDNSFDLAISIVTLHNLEIEECGQSLREIERVSRNAFITLDAYSNEEEKAAMEAWNLTALTVMHVDDWRDFFAQNGYKGDYYWFMP